MHRLVKRQLQAATTKDGIVDVGTIVAMVSEAYEEFDRDRRRTDRSMTVMIDELERLNETVRDDLSRRLRTAIDSMAHGFSMFDSEHKLIACNDKYLEMYRLPKELGQAGVGLDAIATARADLGTLPVEHQERFFEHIVGIGPGPNHLRYRLADGRIIAVTHTGMPNGGFVAVHQDITAEVDGVRALEATGAKLAQQNLRFDAAINNITQGLCMFDGDERLVICNQSYAVMYALPPELTLPGTRYADILAQRAARGTGLEGGPDAQIAELRRRMAEGRSARYEHDLTDGRTISVQLHPMADRGWVATHEDVTEQRSIEARISHLARHDALTDLPNRVLLREELDKLEARIREGHTVAVLCLDLDHFKVVNDTLGHAVGDEVLVTVARRLRAVCRPADVVARLGGDEFAILVNSLGDNQAAAALSDRMVRSVAEPIDVAGREILVGASVGIAIAPVDGRNAETLLRKADMALYRAKNNGRGAFHFFEKGMDEALQRRRALEQGLRAAAARREFRLVYQPIIELANNRICCLEALLRWERPNLASVSPLEFLPIAEEIGIITIIGEWVLREACRTAASWPDDIHVAVNLSASQFKSYDLVDQVTRALADSGLAPERLEIEITESILLNDAALTLETLHRLRARGIRISMDDFGTGYSSPSYLRAFPFDKIKIDRSFVAGIAPGGDALTIVSAVIGLCQNLGMPTTAEGVETEEQLESVRKLGCREAQGFLFSLPLPASQIEGLLQASRHGYTLPWSHAAA